MGNEDSKRLVEVIAETSPARGIVPSSQRGKDQLQKPRLTFQSPGIYNNSTHNNNLQADGNGYPVTVRFTEIQFSQAFHHPEKY
jgi:hypothetical protein